MKNNRRYRNRTKRHSHRLADAASAGIYEAPITLQDGCYRGEAIVEEGASRPEVNLLIDLSCMVQLEDRSGTMMFNPN